MSDTTCSLCRGEASVFERIAGEWVCERCLSADAMRLAVEIASLRAQLASAEAKLRTVDDVICWGVECVHQAACSQHCLEADEQLAAADALAGAVRSAPACQCDQCDAVRAALATYDAVRKGK